jgi:hypothetical protein
MGEADAFVDGQGFRFDELAEFDNFRKLSGLRGIEIIDIVKTQSSRPFRKYVPSYFGFLRRRNRRDCADLTPPK